MFKKTFKKLGVLSTLLASMVLFQNCLIEIRAVPWGNPPHPTPTPVPVSEVIEIDYSSSGGFPGPNGPFYTQLSLRLNANGSIDAKLGTETCSALGKASKGEFDLIVRNSKLAQMEPIAAGTGTTGAAVSTASGQFVECADCPFVSLVFTMRNGDQSRMYPLSEASAQINAIVSRIKNESCQRPQPLFQSVRYFRGGWFGIAPNWAHDFRIGLSQQQDGQTPVTGKHPDPYCFKAGRMSETQVKQLYDLIAGLRTEVSEGPLGADSGIEIVEIVYPSGETKTIHLMRMEVPAKALYAVNPQELSKFLNYIGDSMNMVACQSAPQSQ